MLQKDIGWSLADNAPPKVRISFELLREDVNAEQQAAALLPVTTAADAADVARLEKQAPVAGFVVAGVGATVAAAGVVTGVVGERIFADAGSAFSDRASGRAVALAGWSGVAIGVVVTAVGVAVLVVAE